MGLKQGEIKVTGRWTQDRRRARQQIYRVAGGSAEIRNVGEDVASAAKTGAETAVRSKSALRGDLALVPSQITFKDIRQFSIAKNGEVSKKGDQILVGLVVSDSFLSMALEFGADTREGYVSPSGFMRAAALKVAKKGYRFQPAKASEQQRVVSRAQRAADRAAKRRSTQARKAAKARWKGRRRRRK